MTSKYYRTSMNEGNKASKGPSTRDNATRAGASVASTSTRKRVGSDEFSDSGDGDDEREPAPDTRKRRGKPLSDKKQRRRLWPRQCSWELAITSPETPPTTRQQVGGIADRQSDTDSNEWPAQTRILGSPKDVSDVAFHTIPPVESEGEPQGSMGDVMGREDSNDGSFSPRNSPGSKNRDFSLPKSTRRLVSGSETFPDADSTVQTQGVLNGLDYGKYS